MDSEQIHVHLHFPEELFCELGAFRAELRNILALVTVDSTQIDAVVSGLATLKADSATAFADITAKLNSIAGSTPDPATAAAIQGVISDIATLDSSTKAIDPGPVTTTPASTAP